MANNKKAVFGIILIVLGFLFLARTMDFFYFDFGEIVKISIPLGLIALGGWLILRRQRRETLINAQVYSDQSTSDKTSSSSFAQSSSPHVEVRVSSSDSGSEQRYQSSSESSQGYQSSNADARSYAGNRVRYSKSFGDMYIECTGVSLQNVEISSFFGDIEIRLHGGKLEPGLNRLVVSGFMGDIRIVVPPDMPVMAHVSSFAGDVEALNRRASGFGNNIEAQSETYHDAKSRLFVAVNTFVGDTRLYQA